MEIIEFGKGWALEERCTGKGNGDGGRNSLLLVAKDDLYFNGSVCDGQCTRYIFSFKCPICGLWTDVDDEKLPYNIKKKLLFDDNGQYKNNIRKRIR